MNKILVFSHLMKTAGTALSKALIGYFGPYMHIAPGGLKMDAEIYKRKDLERDMGLFNDKLKIISGHRLRPYYDFGELEERLCWFTFLRNPAKRYVSHYLHDKMWTENFRYKRYENMKTGSIEEWEAIENYANYQTKFIAGEENVNKAIDILEAKMDWVGLTEDFLAGLCSFKQHFALEGLYVSNSKANTSLANQADRNLVFSNFASFIEEKNELDVQLYQYVKENIYPRFKLDDPSSFLEKGRPLVYRNVNMIRFQINRQLKYRTTELNLQNLNRFFTRWYR